MLTGVAYSCNTKKKAQTETVETKKTEPVIIPISELYSRSCGVCHDLPVATDYDSTEWRGILKSMQKRAHLNDKNIEDIYQYLISQK